jgi:hypothetical protein
MSGGEETTYMLNGWEMRGLCDPAPRIRVRHCYVVCERAWRFLGKVTATKVRPEGKKAPNVLVA